MVQYPYVSKQYTKYTRYKPKVLQSDDCTEFDIRKLFSYLYAEGGKFPCAYTVA